MTTKGAVWKSSIEVEQEMPQWDTNHHDDMVIRGKLSHCSLIETSAVRNRGMDRETRGE